VRPRSSKRMNSLKKRRFFHTRENVAVDPGMTIFAKPNYVVRTRRGHRFPDFIVASRRRGVHKQPTGFRLGPCFITIRAFLECQVECS